jgi:tRNA threonylcarbamoyladenosine biosynthesis protein TsaE
MIANPASTRVVVTSDAPDQTRALAAALASVARPGDRLELYGELGAGKTEFAKGFAEGLGVTAVVNSPSFTLMAEYAGRLPLFHIDLYRLAGADEAFAAGVVDERQMSGVTLVEWAERLRPEQPPQGLQVRIEPEADERRIIELTAVETDYGRYLQAAAPFQS